LARWGGGSHDVLREQKRSASGARRRAFFCCEMGERGARNTISAPEERRALLEVSPPIFRREAGVANNEMVQAVVMAQSLGLVVTTWLLCRYELAQWPGNGVTGTLLCRVWRTETPFQS
jgi:hypothetical protein